MHAVSKHPIAGADLTPLDGAAVGGLLHSPGAHPVSVRKRRFLFHQGDDCEGIYYLQAGLVALQRVDERGAFIIFSLVKPGGFFSWSDLLGCGRHRNSAQVLSTAKAVFVPRNAFLMAMREDPQALNETLGQASREIQDYEDIIFHLCTYDVPARLYWALCRLAGAESAEGDAIEFKPPVLKRELAAMIGTSPEGVSRGIRRLEELNIARFTGKTVWLNLHAA